MDEEAPINLTPLIDVVFVILIMFIVVAPLLELDRIQLADGIQEEKLPATQRSDITLHVRADNSLLLNKKPILLESLPATLHLLHTRFPGQIPQVYHDKEATFGTYQAVKNALEEAGFSQMDVVLKPCG